MKEADLIRNQREEKFIYYELNTSVLKDLMLWITDLKGTSDDEGNDKKYRGSLISSILIILTEMSQTGAFYRLKSHNFVTLENGHPFG